MREPVFLELKEVIEIHSDQLNRYGGHPGIRDIELRKVESGRKIRVQVR